MPKQGQTIRGATAGRGSRAYFEIWYCILQKEMQSNGSQINEKQIQKSSRTIEG